MFKAGDAVEVRMVWAANGNGLPPSRAWFPGYTFVREGVVKHVGGTYDGLEVNYSPADIRAPQPHVTFKVELSNAIARGQAVGNLYGVGRYLNDCRTFWALEPQTSREVAHAFADKWNAIAACPFQRGEACTCGYTFETHSHRDVHEAAHGGLAIIPPKGAK